MSVYSPTDSEGSDSDPNKRPQRSAPSNLVPEVCKKSIRLAPLVLSPPPLPHPYHIERPLSHRTFVLAGRPVHRRWQQQPHPAPRRPRQRRVVVPVQPVRAREPPGQPPGVPPAVRGGRGRRRGGQLPPHRHLVPRHRHAGPVRVPFFICIPAPSPARKTPIWPVLASHWKCTKRCVFSLPLPRPVLT